MSSLKLSFHRYLPNVAPLELASETQAMSYPPSSENRIRPEHCPAVLGASRLGVMVRTACEHCFDADGDYQILLYPTTEQETGILGYEIMTPCLVGSNEQSPGYYKIATGVSFDAGDVGWILTAPIDPRLSPKCLTISTGYFEPGYRGPIFAIVQPKSALIIDRDAIIGQMFPLSMATLMLKEETVIVCSADCVEAKHSVRKNHPGVRISRNLLNAHLLEFGRTGLTTFLEKNGTWVDLSS